MSQRHEDPAALVAECSPSGQCLVEDGRVVYANDALGELLGADSDELEGETVADVIGTGGGVDDRDDGGDDGTSIAEKLADLSDETVTLRFEVDAGPGPTRTVESRWTVVDDVADGGGSDAVTGPIAGTFEDVTERVELERESEMLDSALANLPMSIYFKDRRSRHERVSEHLLCQDEDNVITNGEGKRHHAPDDVVGKTDFDLYSGDWVADAVAEDETVMETGEPIVDDVTESTTSLGETFFSSTTKAPRYDEEGNVVGIVGVTMDVTDRLSSQRELERQNERMEEFTEVLTHDLRNPLTVASGYASMLDDRYDDPAIGKIEESLERMSSLIGEIRAFVLEGRTVESPEPVDLADVASDACESVETGDATVDVEASHTVKADAGRVRQLFENLYCNAVEHGGETVTITVGDLEDGFYVADDGPGIPDEDKPHVFERGFSTGEDSTGFGLAIVRNIAEAHDWRVEVTDGADGGARFEFHGVVRVEDGADDGA